MSQKTFNIQDFNERCNNVYNFLEAQLKLHNRWAEEGKTSLSKEEELEEVKVRS